MSEHQEGHSSEHIPRLAGDSESLSIQAYMDAHGLTGGISLHDAGRRADAVYKAQERLGSDKRYQIVERIGKGAMGAIHAAKDLNLRRVVAMKVMLRTRGARPEDLLRFIEEAQITGQLEHPGIVPVYELGVDHDDHIYYTMKRIEGEDLETILDRMVDGDETVIRRYPLARLLDIFRRVCEAIAFAHDKGVIHRDLKPANLMVGAYGEVLVLDWGLAKIVLPPDLRQPSGEQRRRQPRHRAQRMRTDRIATVDSERLDQDLGDLTMNGAIVGTPLYMPPEQAEGRRLDHRTDIYALGAILYHILTLDPPVTGKNVQAILQEVIKGNITAPALRRLKPSQLPHCPDGRIPAALSAVCMKALSHSKRDRYRCVQDLIAELTAWQNGFATEAQQATSLVKFRLLIGRHQSVSVLLSILFLAIIGGGGWFLWRLAEERNAALTARDVAIQERERALIAQDVAVQAGARAEEARLDLAIQFYKTQLTQAATLLFQGKIDTAQAVLSACEPSARRFEWGLLNQWLERQQAVCTSLPINVRNATVIDADQAFVYGNSFLHRFVCTDTREIQASRLEYGQSLWSCADFTQQGNAVIGLARQGKQLEFFQDLLHQSPILRWPIPDSLAKSYQIILSENGRFALLRGQPGWAVLDLVKGQTSALTKLLFQANTPCAAIPNSDAFLLHDQDGHFLRLDPTTGQVQRFANSTKPSLLRISATGLVAAADADCRISLGTLADDSPWVHINAHRHTITHLLFTADGKRLFSSDSSGLHHLWDCRNGENLQQWSTPAIQDASITADDHLWLFRTDHHLNRLDLNQPQSFAAFTPYQALHGYISQAIWCPDGRLLLGFKNGLQIIDQTALSSGLPQFAPDTLGSWVERTITPLSPAGEFLRTRSRDGQITHYRYDWPSGAYRPVDLPEDLIALSDDAAWRLYASPEVYRLEQPGQAQPIMTIPIWSSPFKTGQTLLGNRFLAVQSGPNEVLVISREDPQRQIVITPDRNHLSQIVSDRTEEHLLIATTQDLACYSLHDGALMARFVGYDAPAQATALSPNGDRLALVDSSSTLRLYDTQSGDLLLDLGRLDYRQAAVSFSPDGRHLLVKTHAPLINRLYSATSPALRPAGSNQRP